MNKLFKRVSYWKNKFKNLEAAVSQWRKIEKVRNGFITVNEDESSL